MAAPPSDSSTLSQALIPLVRKGIASFSSNPSLVGGALLVGGAFIVGGALLRLTSSIVGIAYPTYCSFKAVEENDTEKQKEWTTYWTCYSVFTVAEAFTDRLLFWFPKYYLMKLAFLVWLQHPRTRGAKFVYENLLSPLVKKHRENNKLSMDDLLAVTMSSAQKIFKQASQDLSDPALLAALKNHLYAAFSRAQQLQQQQEEQERQQQQQQQEQQQQQQQQ